MEQIDKMINIQKLAADIMSLTSGDIEELTNELKEHWWESNYNDEICISPETLASVSIIDVLKEPNKTESEAKLKIAEWFKKYSELEKQHQEDEMWMETIREENVFWTEFWKYITDEAIGDKQVIIDTVANNEHNFYEGYVDVTKSINKEQELLLTFKNKNGQEYTAVWQPSDNYACWQTCGMTGDDYSGYLLFPTYENNRYFCISYTC